MSAQGLGINGQFKGCPKSLSVACPESVEGPGGRTKVSNHFRRKIMTIRSLLLAAIATPALLASTALFSAHAEDAAPAEAESFFKITGNFGLYSDYRFRGVSLNDKKITPQGTLTLTTSPGFYVGTFGSPTISFAGGTEIDVFGGYSGAAGPANFDVGVVGYLYPKAGQLSYYEVYGSVSGSLGPITPKVGFYWAPSQNALLLGNSELSTRQKNFYVYGGLTAAIPDTPFSVNAQVGVESGAFDYRPTGSKVDWQVGASATYHGLTLSANYIDSNVADNYALTFQGKDAAKGTVVVALVYNF
jgi:uncharacterized protein (TIGR02001 family)